MARISVHLIGERQAKAMFDNAARAIDNPLPAMKEISKMQHKEVQEAFKVSGKNITGSPWKPLRPNTVKEKIRSGFQTRILERTGRMKSSFVTKTLTAKSIRIANTAPYFPQHQQGKSGGTFGAKIPKRQMLGHSDRMVTNAMNIFQTFITNEARKAV